MKIAFSRYELNSRTRLGQAAGSARSGALLRFEFPETGFGYADCHPWPELGDAPLSEQLRLLTQGELTSITRRSLRIAETDAQARAVGQSLFSGIVIPESHILLGNVSEVSAKTLADCGREGFFRVKLKAGRDPEKESSHLHALSLAAREEGLKLRIDFNESLTVEEAKLIFDRLCAGDAASGVDFIEDPTPFVPEVWRGLKERFPLRLARDRAAGEPDPSIDVLVVKPAIQNPETLLAEKSAAELVITTYLDHALGVISAAYAAAQARKHFGSRIVTCGLLTHVNYESDDFFSSLRHEGPRLLAPAGTGLGFDELLAQVNWEPLI